MSKFNKILLVEDDLIDAYLSKMVLQQMDISEEIVLCKDGREALHCIETYKDTSSPDLILLDIQMPGMDGIEFLQELRKTYSDNFTIVILSSSSHPKDIAYAGRYEACYYLVKPLTEEKVKKMIERCFVD
jgi:CheY-like chemotaxis protein